MRRVCARLRRLNRASSSAGEKVRLWGRGLSVVRLTGSPHRRKIFDQQECAQKPPPNLSVPRRGASRKGVVGSRCGNDAPWKAWKSPAHDPERRRRETGLFHPSHRAWKSRPKPRRAISTFPPRRRRFELHLRPSLAAASWTRVFTASPPGKSAGAEGSAPRRKH